MGLTGAVQIGANALAVLFDNVIQVEQFHRLTRSNPSAEFRPLHRCFPTSQWIFLDGASFDELYNDPRV